jgi:flagellar hook-associated protein 3 FlgL
MRIAWDNGRNLLAALERIREQGNTATQQLATGRRVDLPSDDPAAAAAWVGVRTRLDQADQFTRNISSLRATAQTSDSVLNSVVLSLTRAIALGTEGGNGTLSDPARQALAQEVSNLHTQLMDLANTSINGIYLFAGTAVTTPPYMADAASSSGVQYNGNGNAITAEINSSETIQVQLPGDSIFSSAGADVFQALHDLTTALQTGGDVAGATTSVKTALDHVGVQRISYGAVLARLDQTEQALGSEKVSLGRQESDLVAADIAQVATDYSQAQTALQAALQAGGKLSQLTLLDFLR